MRCRMSIAFVVASLALQACAPKQPVTPQPASPVEAPAPVGDDDRALEDSVADLERQLRETKEQLRVVVAEVEHLRVRLERAERPKPEPKRPGRPDPAAYYRVPVQPGNARGPATALVTIVEWADFQCPYSQRVQPTLAALERKYEGDLRIVFKHNPLYMHKHAMEAAIAAEAAAEQGKFWAMHDKLFDNRKAISDANILKWARQLKLDLKKFKRDLKNPDLKARVEAMQADGVKVGARGTPAFFINGRFLSGAQPIASFSTLIDEEMARARNKVRQGVPRAEVYELTVSEGLDRVD